MDTKRRPFLPFAVPEVGEEEIAEVVDTLRSGWLTTGPKTAAFEEAFAKAVGARHALAVNSATAGLHLALEAVGVRSGDLVITTPWTFTATAEVVRYLGADPLFVDVDPRSLNICPEEIEKSLDLIGQTQRQKLRAVLPVHFGGQGCAMDRIVDIASRWNLKIVEDAAHAFPATAYGPSVDNAEAMFRNIGTIGHTTVFSFYVTKTITTGEGGMVTTSNDEFARRIRLMRLHGINRDVWDRYQSEKSSWYYEVVEPGFKYNLTDIASAIGLHQLKKAADFQRRRDEIAARYNQAFSEIPEVEIPRVINPKSVHSWHLYVLRLNLEMLRIDRDGFIRQMAERGIGCSVHFIPLHLHPYWRDQYRLTEAEFPVATKEFLRVVSLPIYPGLVEAAVDRVIEAVRDICRKYRR